MYSALLILNPGDQSVFSSASFRARIARFFLPPSRSFAYFNQFAMAVSMLASVIDAVAGFRLTASTRDQKLATLLEPVAIHKVTFLYGINLG